MTALTPLIDTHCHLTLKSSDEIISILERAAYHNVTRCICIGASDGTKSSYQAVKIASEHSGVFATVGIHPHDADNHSWDKQLEDLAASNKVVAIGETGLDYFKEWASFDKQKDLFSHSISVAKKLKKPLVIHCRNAEDDALSILASQNASEVGGVFHCYSGSSELARNLQEMNFRVSYTGILTFKNSNKVRDEASKIPLSQIMLETDSPYMAPDPYRGEESEPSHVAIIAETLAKLQEIPLSVVCEQTSKNAEALFKLPT